MKNSNSDALKLENRKLVLFIKFDAMSKLRCAKILKIQNWALNLNSMHSEYPLKKNKNIKHAISLEKISFY